MDNPEDIKFTPAMEYRLSTVEAVLYIAISIVNFSYGALLIYAVETISETGYFFGAIIVLLSIICLYIIKNRKINHSIVLLISSVITMVLASYLILKSMKMMASYDTPAEVAILFLIPIGIHFVVFLLSGVLALGYRAKEIM